jgi:hypothetical protein
MGASVIPEKSRPLDGSPDAAVWDSICQIMASQAGLACHSPLFIK